MTESSEVQVLEKICSEVDESQIKVILSTQCIKAQTFLVDKLRKQSDRQKEVCSFISSANIKLVAEIKQAEQEINSLHIAQETIKSANIELKKEWLLAKENKQDIIERVKTGKKKYEDMWLEAKNRFESLPYVQLLLENIEKSKGLESSLELIENEANTLIKKIEEKIKLSSDLDRKRIIELAEFMVHEMPNSIKIIKEKSAAIEELTKEIDELIKVANTGDQYLKNSSIDEKHLPTIEETKKASLQDDNDDDDDVDNLDDTLMMPKLQLGNIDLDDISLKLNQMKVKKDANINKPANIMDSITYDSRISDDNYGKEKSIHYIPSCFNSTNIFEENKTQSFSNRKLINILEDIKVDKDDAFIIVSRVNPDKLQTVTTISVDNKSIPETSKQSKTNFNEPMESDEIEEIDLTNSNNILIPPTQFLDPSMERIRRESQKDKKVVKITREPEKNKQNSQDSVIQKKVSFDVPSSQSLKVANEASKKLEENDVNESINSQLDVSAASEESFLKIKDMIIKKHKLDLSPQFVYAKNNLIQMRNDDRIVSSKFFNQMNQIDSQIENEQMDVGKDIDPEKKGEDEHQPPVFQTEEKRNNENLVPMEVDELRISSPKINIQDEHKIDKPVAGLLFTHGNQAIPDFLNVSMSTTGYEDGDNDFPHCIDSSLLLSPKADVAMPMSCENPEILSQEVPNFLTGLRKTGFSFFGQNNSSEPKLDSSAQNQGNSFNFNFVGTEDKKNRGGLFSMFN